MAARGSSRKDPARRVEALARLARAVSESLELGEVLSSVAHAALDLLTDAYARIWVMEGDTLVLRAEAGLRHAQGPDERVVIDLGAELAASVAATRAPVIIEDLGAHPSATNGELVHPDRYVSFVGIPLLARDSLVGVMSLLTPERHQFTGREIDLLRAFSDHAAIAIDNARMYENATARVWRLRTLTRVNQLISSALTVTDVLREITGAAAQLMDAPVAAFWQANEAERILRVVAFSDPQAGADFPFTSTTFDHSIIGWIATHRQPAHVADVFADERFVAHDWSRQHGFTSFLGIPVILHGSLLAVLSFTGREPFRIGKDEEDLLETFAAQAAVAIRNAELFQTSERRRAAAEALAAVGRALTQSLDPHVVAERILDSIRGLLHVPAPTIFELDPNSGDLVPRFTGPEHAEVFGEGLVLPRGSGTAGLAVLECMPVWTPDVLTDPRVTLDPELRRRVERSSYRAVLSVPLIAHGRVIGALSVGDGAGRTFDDEEIRLAQIFADQAALALENARLHQEARTREARLETLLDVSRSTARIQPVETLLERIAEACGRLLASDSVGFRLLEGEERLKVGESLSGHVAATGEPLAVSDTRDPRLTREHGEAFERLGYRGWLGVPVKIGTRVAGVLSVRTRQPKSFTDEDLRIATAFASQAAVALENARLYEAVESQLHELESTQAQLLQAGKLAAVGQLVAGVAHELNNPLAVVAGHAELLEQKSSDAGTTERARKILTSARRAARIIKELQTFARPTPRELAVVRLADVVERMLALREQTLRASGIAVERNVTAGLPPVLADAAQLEQVVLNLLLNAEHASKTAGGRTITVRLTAAGGRVRLAVSDRGAGIPGDVLPRIFEPFFTTKPVGQGTGLGLAICYSTVRAHGGRIWAESPPGEGATVVVELPAHEIPASTSGPKDTSLPRGRVLVVDDEPEVADTIRELLEALGQEVTVVVGGATALERLLERDRLWDVVTLDIKMPDLSGREIWERLRDEQHPIADRIVFLTGDIVEEDTQEFLGDAGRPILTKPVSLAALTAVLSAMLGSR